MLRSSTPVVASDFYICDGGVRYNGDAVMAVIKALHAAGKRFDWNMTEPDVHSGIGPDGFRARKA